MTLSQLSLPHHLVCKLAQTASLISPLLLPYHITDWPSHKKYCRHWVYQRHKDLQASSGMQFAANPKSSAVFNAALEAAKAKASGGLYTWFIRQILYR